MDSWSHLHGIKVKVKEKNIYKKLIPYANLLFDITNDNDLNLNFKITGTMSFITFDYKFHICFIIFSYIEKNKFLKYLYLKKKSHFIQIILHKYMIGVFIFVNN